ncbi:MAG: DUF721 domain-containing protein [Candidatus Cyclobacteriaceae bacterium M2_1C_046]
MANKNNEYSMKEALQQWLEKSRLNQKFNEAKLIEAWSQLMGPTITRYTEKIFIKDRVLYLKISSPALRHELSMSKNKILELFSKNIGENVVLDVRLL